MAVAQEAIDQFKQRAVGRRITEGTAREYETWIHRYELWRDHSRDPDLDDLLDFDTFLHNGSVEEYPWDNTLGRPVEGGYSYSSRVKAMSALKLWLRYEYGIRIEEDANNIVMGEPADFRPDYLSKDDVARVVAQANGACKCDGCAAALALSYDAIMRASELVLVDVDDIDLGAGTIYVHATKGSISSEISLSGGTLSLVEEHVRDHPGRRRLFRNSYGNGWRKWSWSKHFRTKHHEVGSHAFGRHSPIIHRLNDGEGFGEVYRRARHAYPSTTAKYARYVGRDVPDWASE